MKTCTKCGDDKPLTDFYFDSDGYPKSRCKRCYGALVKRYSDANRDRRNQLQNERRALKRQRGIA